MHLHTQVEKALRDFLVDKKGFRVNDLLEDPIYTNADGISGVRPDLVGVDPKLREPIAIFEVKSEYREKDAKHINQVRSYFRIDSEGRTPVYLVVGPPTDIQFYKYSDDTNTLEPINKDQLPTAGQFRASRFDPQLAEIRRKADQTRDSLKIACWLAAACLIILAIADFICSFYEISILTAERMALIGGAVAAIIIPYAQKFKGLGIEYERKSKD